MNLPTKALCFFLSLYSASPIFAQSVYISGVDDLKDRTRITVLKYHPTFDPIYGNPPTIARAVYQNDSTFTIDIPVKESAFVYFNIPSRGFSHASWVSPGDSLQLSFNKDKPHPFWFLGKHAFHYNAYYDVKRLSKQLYDANISTLKAFKSFYNKIDRTMDSLILQARKERTTNDLFTDILLEENKAKYISDLRNFMKKFDENDQSLAYQEIVDRHGELESDTLLTSRVFTIGLVTPLSSGVVSAPFHIGNYTKEMEYVAEHFSGRIKDYLMGYLTSRYITGIVNDEQNSKTIYNKVTGEIASTITDSIFRQWALDNMDFVNKLGQTLPDVVLRESLLDHDGYELSVKQLLEKYKGKYVLLDVWASWCVPCLQELEASRAMEDQLKELGIHFIYLTIDDPKDYDKMRNLASKYGIGNHNYILQNRRSSILSDYLNIASGQGIPRYILFDREGKLESLNMPRPSDMDNFKSRLQTFTKKIKSYD